MRMFSSLPVRALVRCGVATALGAIACSGTEESAVSSISQGLTGTLVISGRVTTPTGAPVSGARMVLAGMTSKTVTTDANGMYSFTNLAPGSYTVTPAKTGLKFCSAFAALGNLRRDTAEDFSGSTTGCVNPVYQKKVMVLNYDPTVTKPDGTTAKLSAYMNWDDATQLAGQFQRSMESMTNGRVKYVIEKTKNIDDIPVKMDGFDYTPEAILTCLADTTQCHMPDDTDYLAIVNSQGICTDVNAGVVDEVWMFGGPYFGFYESRLAGPNAYWYNSPGLDGTTCNKLVPIMGFNYERGIAEMVHDVTHRTESAMSRVYGSWQENRMNTNWDRFALVAAQSPSFGFSGCGTGHYAPTSTEDYQYDNATPVSSFCDDFYNYPNLKPPASALKTITCAAWGCRELGYYRYFFQHLPKATGIASDGKFSDWWRYIVSPNDVFLTDSVSCSSEYAPGWCQALVDGQKGVCNEGEWATLSLPTGWAKITLPAARAVTSVMLYDRACDEQVIAGHLEFSNGSPNIAFGALENTGTIGTKVSFASKTLSWVKVVIDQSTGVNPGLGEVVIQ
jgi:hypothetical protein